MVASSTMDRESVSLLRDYVNLLLQCVPYLSVESVAYSTHCALYRFMVENKDRLFQAEYENTSSAYQNISRA